MSSADFFSSQCFIVRLFLLTSLLNCFSHALQCFSCHGECYSERRCNCQTGMCEGDYCFTEKWAREGGFVIYKGCGKGRPRIGAMDSCEHQRLQERAFCLCNDDDFCNEAGAWANPSQNNASCLHCSGGSCKSRCNMGDYCLADFNRNQYSCAYGKPVLPFHYQGQSLQQTNTKPWPACISFRAGPAYHIAECACTNPICNNPTYLRDQIFMDEVEYPLIQCHSCAEETLSESVLPQCRRQTCLGQFCAIKIESVFDPLASALGGAYAAAAAGASGGASSSGSVWTKTHRYKQWAGCLNSTRPDQVMRGTFQRWTVGTRQVTECVCRKDNCNLDVKSCVRAGGSTVRINLKLLSIFSSLLAFLVL